MKNSALALVLGVTAGITAGYLVGKYEKEIVKAIKNCNCKNETLLEKNKNGTISKRKKKERYVIL